MPKLDLTTLESCLWDSANILSVSIDNSDFKNYIFGLLFLKRFNDLFDEIVDTIIERDNISYRDAVEETHFRIPLEANWDELIMQTENIGVALDRAFAAIERENTCFEGVMTATKFGDKEKLSDEVLQRLMRHFNQYSLKNMDQSKSFWTELYKYVPKWKELEEQAIVKLYLSSPNTLIDASTGKFFDGVEDTLRKFLEMEEASSHFDSRHQFQ